MIVALNRKSEILHRIQSADQAGPAGKGFAVVTSEVKNLARDTFKAADTISQRVETITSSVGEPQDSTTSEIVQTTGETAESMRSAHDDTKTLADFAQNASGSAEEMAIVIKDVRNGVNGLYKTLRDFLNTLNEKTTGNS